MTVNVRWHVLHVNFHKLMAQYKNSIELMQMKFFV